MQHLFTESLKSFDDYCKVDPIDLDLLKKMKALNNPYTQQLFLLELVQKYLKSDDKNQVYEEMKQVIRYMFLAEESKSTCSLVCVTISGMYKLDVLCGYKLPSLTSEQSEADKYRALISIHEDRQKFKQLLSESLAQFALLRCNTSHLHFFLTFAQLVFMFNGYQSPVVSELEGTKMSSIDAFNKMVKELYNI